MTKILLIYPNKARARQIPMGLAYISSYLKENGVETFLWDGTFDGVHDLTKKIRLIRPDVLCFSGLSPDAEFMWELGKIARGITSVPFVVGGYHATFKPRYFLSHSFGPDIFNAVIVGEGEYVLLDYLQGRTVGNVLKGRLADVDNIPWPDHEMFKRHFIKQLGWESGKHETVGVFLTSRGCPFKCTYCSCDALSKLYPPGKITRFRNIDNVIAEVSEITQRYKMDTIWFTDETFTVKKSRVIEFCHKYKDNIGIPFSIETRPDTVDSEILLALKDAGCTTIRMGIESGSDRIRNELYQRKISRKQILDAFLIAKKMGLKTASFNICGAPTETIEDIRETISLNVECKVDSGKMTLLSVFPGTKMWNYCAEHGYAIRDRYPLNYYVDSNITHESLSIKDLIKLRHEFNKALKNGIHHEW